MVVSAMMLPSSPRSETVTGIALSDRTRIQGGEIVDFSGTEHHAVPPVLSNAAGACSTSTVA